MSRIDFLFEVGTEEIPAGYLAPALAALEERLSQALTAARLDFKRLRTWATPRRLAVGLWGLAEGQADTLKEITGPPVKVAFDQAGRPTKAALSFAQNQGVDVADLITVETKKGEYLAVRRKEQGRPTAEVLTEILPPLILGLPFPKVMRWGRGEVAFVRPIHWVLAVLDGRVLPLSLGGITAADTSRGHRFLHPEPVEIDSPDDYENRLAAAHVIVSFDRRLDLVQEEIARAAAENGTDLRVLPDEELETEVANLVEEPAAICGRFDESFLKLPAPVLITAMREHQRYFALTDGQGRLQPYFIAVNNTRARDLNVVRRGHQRVLRARLDDARFYFEDDRKTTLESKQEALKEVVFHSLLGTSWEKVQRFTRLAEDLADRLDPAVKPVLLRAAGLCKCDLVTGVVGQFPSLQGVMGREYALLDGEPEEVAQAIQEHYWPIRAGGELPRTSAGALLSLADKIDTICGCFGVGLIPTGAADPYALRRQALGVINIILDQGYRLDLGRVIGQALTGLQSRLTRPAEAVRAEVLEFFRLRLKNQLTGQGASTDGAEAVLSLHYQDLVPAAARVWALEEIKARLDFQDLAVAFKRVVNIIKKFGAKADFDPNLLAENEEKALLAAVEDVAAQTRTLASADDYAGLLRLIVGLKPAIDTFFDRVLVDAPDPKLKTNRLALLTRIADLFALIADFSKIST